MHIDLTPANLL